MVRNKRGQFFALLLVIFTLLLCGTAISLYIVQQENAQGSLVSPSDVLEMRDNLTIFEMREIELMKSSLESASGEFRSDGFLESFRSGFIDGVMENENMTEFLFSDLYIGGVEVREQDKGRNLLEDGIYLEGLMSFSDDVLSFGRTNIEKRTLLIAKNESEIDFPVYFEFEFEREYEITDVNGKFEVAKA